MEDNSLLIMDTSSLWLVVGGFALFLGLVAAGINYNIRRSREATDEQTRRLTRELEQLRQGAVVGGASQDPEDLRKEAVREALRREPQFSDSTDSADRQRLSELVDQIVGELQIQREIAQVKAEEAAEARRVQAELEYARKTEESRRQAEEARQRREQATLAKLRARDEELARMSPARRWIVTHKGLVVGVVVSLLALVAVGALMANSIAQSSRLAAEQAAESAAAASSASLAAASASAEAEAEAQVEQARQDLLVACDEQVLDQVAQDEDVLFAWTQCQEAEVALKAAVALVELGTPRKVSLAGRDLAGMDLSGADLSGVRFDRANLEGADLSNSNLYDTVFYMANLSGANLSGASMMSTSLTEADLTQANLDQANLKGSILRETDFTGASVKGAKLDSVFWTWSICPSGTQIKETLVTPWPC